MVDTMVGQKVLLPLSHLLVPETNLAAGCRGDKLCVRTDRASSYRRLVSLRW